MPYRLQWSTCFFGFATAEKDMTDENGMKRLRFQYESGERTPIGVSFLRI